MPTQIVGATRTPASASTRREMGLDADRIRAEDTVRTVLLRASRARSRPLTRERLFDLAPVQRLESVLHGCLQRHNEQRPPGGGR
jgi:hypothetical protein